VIANDGAVLAGLRERSAAERWFSRFAAFVLAYLLFVILFGAWVRITGSGAGCGDHWPTCHGELVPRSPSAQTLIEYTHRLTSGTLGLMALALPLLAARLFPRRHPARRFAWLTFVLVLVEAGIGAGLVLRQLVALDASVARAVAVAVHLTNTLLLTACSALTVVTSREHEAQPGPRATALLPLLGLLGGLVLVASSGAVTALGDTLFPVGGAAPPPPEHFLVQLRVLHPIVACFMVCACVLVAIRFARVPRSRPWAVALGAAAGAELVMGALNIALHAPGALQLAHLLGAQLVWLSAVVLAWSLRWGAASPVGAAAR